MEGKYSRVEKNSNLYIDNVYDHKLRILIYYILMPLFILLSLFAILTDNVKASDVTIDVTNVTYTGTENCLTNQKGICVMAVSDLSWGRYVIGDTDYAYMGALNFIVNQSVLERVHATIRLTGTYWANTNYSCVSSFSNCRVVRANHNILNINFSNLTTHSVSGGQFLISADGNPMNDNNPFKITKVTLYETWIDNQDIDTGSNADIINNDNQNTQDIINNINQGIEDVSSNLNSNFQDTINAINSAAITVSGDLQAETDKLLSNTTCPVGPLSINYSNWYKQNGYLDSSGNVISGNGGISTYFEVLPNSDYVITANNSISGAYYCIYTSQKTLITCYQMNNTILTLHTSSRTSFLRMSINKNTSYTLNGPVCNDWVKEEQQTTNDTLNNINDSITNNNVDSNTGTDFFNDFQTTDNGGISAIVTKPLHIINSLLSSNSQCANLNLPPILGANNVSIPSGCILWDHADNTMTTLWYTFVCGLGSYFVLKDLFKWIETLKNPDNDKVEVVDL